MAVDPLAVVWGVTQFGLVLLALLIVLDSAERQWERLKSKWSDQK